MTYMIERKHGAFTHRENPRLIAEVKEIKRWQFNERAEVREDNSRKSPILCLRCGADGIRDSYWGEHCNCLEGPLMFVREERK